jgi:UDP-N-acetylglucosamine acyltransferase
VAKIHATAQVEGKVSADVTIGPFCVVGPQIALAAGVRLHENVIIKGDTEIGERTEMFPFASIGQAGEIAGCPVLQAGSGSERGASSGNM